MSSVPPNKPTNPTQPDSTTPKRPVTKRRSIPIVKIGRAREKPTPPPPPPLSESSAQGEDDEFLGDVEDLGASFKPSTSGARTGLGLSRFAGLSLGKKASDDSASIKSTSSARSSQSWRSVQSAISRTGVAMKEGGRQMKESAIKFGAAVKEEFTMPPSPESEVECRAEKKLELLLQNRESKNVREQKKRLERLEKAREIEFDSDAASGDRERELRRDVNHCWHQIRELIAILEHQQQLLDVAEKKVLSAKRDLKEHLGSGTNTMLLKMFELDELKDTVTDLKIEIAKTETKLEIYQKQADELKFKLELERRTRR